MLPADADQVTAAFDEFETIAVNCMVPAEATVPVEGVTVTVTGGVTVSPAVAEAVVCATLVAVTVALVVLATVGAVYKPELEMVPGDAVQVTA
jgi:hypothetical protein